MSDIMPVLKILIGEYHGEDHHEVRALEDAMLTSLGTPILLEWRDPYYYLYLLEGVGPIQPPPEESTP